MGFVQVGNTLVFKRNTLWRCNVVNRYRFINLTPFMPDQDENFGGSLVFDLYMDFFSIPQANTRLNQAEKDRAEVLYLQNTFRLTWVPDEVSDFKCCIESSVQQIKWIRRLF